MKKKITSWEGTIRLRPKNPDTTVDILLRDYFNFGEYGELREKVIYDSWDDENFGELRFSTQTRLGGFEEVCYWFTPGGNRTDTAAIAIMIETQHVFCTPENCYLMGNINLFYDNEYGFGIEESRLLESLFICEFENINGIKQSIKKLCKNNFIPFWDNNFERILGYQNDGSTNTSVLGRMRFNYLRTNRYLFYKDKYHYKVIIKNGKPAIEAETQLIMQKSYRDFDLLFQSPARNGLEEINSIHLSKSYSCMMLDETENTGPCMHIEQTLLIKNHLILMGIMRLKGQKNEYNYYKFSFRCIASDIALNQICFSFNLSNNEYWNLEEIDIDNMLQQHLFDND